MGGPEKVSHRYLVVAVCGSEKKHRQSFEKLRRYAEGIRYPSDEGDPSVNRDARRFVFVNMRYNADAREMTTDDDIRVDVVLHKLSTLPPEAFDAFLKWIDMTSARRAQKSLPPVIVIDPPPAARAVMSRSMQMEILEAHPQPSIYLTAHSWRFSRAGEALEPIVWPDRSVEGGMEGCGDWWIAKTDLSTGPAYTHHMVIWRGPLPINGIPQPALDLLPAESATYVVQKFFSFALPFVLKVYCVDNHVAIRAVSALSLSSVLSRGRCPVPGDQEGFTPVCIDSQKIFSNKDVWDHENPQIMQHWRSYLAEGGQAHSRCKEIAAHLSETLRLTLFGFDLLLLPRDTAHRHFLTFEEVVSVEKVEALLFEAVGIGSPTPLLRTASPMVVDINYFPGYAGMPDVERHITEMIESKVAASGP